MYFTENGNSGDVLPETAFGFDVGFDTRLHSPFTVLSVDAYQTILHNQFLQSTTQDGTYTNTTEVEDYGLKILLDAQMLAPFYSPETAGYAADAVEPAKRWTLMREDYASLGFNTDAYPPEQAPHTHMDLLDPKWKGKLGVSATESTLANWVGAMLASEGEDFVRRLGRQSMTLYNMGGRAVDNLVVSGEAPLVINSRYSHMFASRRDGAKVAWRALGPSYTAVSGVALPIRSQHPNAAMLFIDFMLSAQAQKIYVEELGYSSLRTDMVNATAPAKKLYLGLRPDYERDYESWGRLADQVFKNGR